MENQKEKSSEREIVIEGRKFSIPRKNEIIGVVSKNKESYLLSFISKQLNKLKK